MSKYRIAIDAMASFAGQDVPQVFLVIDGVTYGSAAVSSNNAATYSFGDIEINPAQAHQVSIAYPNHTNSSQMVTVQSLRIGDQVIPSSSPLETYVWSGGQLEHWGQMYFGGQINYQLGQDYFPRQAAAPNPAPAPSPVPVPPQTSAPASTSVPAPTPAAPPTTPTAPKPETAAAKPQPVSTAAYHVAVSGNDGNDGSAAHPFATLQRAATAMANSKIKTTVVSGGTYAGGLKLGKADSGESFAAAAGEKVLMKGGATQVAIKAADHVTLSGLSFSGSTGAAVLIDGGGYNLVTNATITGAFGGVLLQNGASHNTVSNSLITGTAFAAIEVKDGSNFNTIDSNLIDGVGPVASNTYGGGIYLHGSSNDVITHNEIRNTAGAGINLSDFNADGSTRNLGNAVTGNKLVNTDLASDDSGAIYILGRSCADTRTLVSMNLIDGTGRADQHSVGIYLDDNANGVTVKGNIVRNVGSDAVEIHGGSNNKVSGNVFDLGTGHPSAVLFQKNPDDQPNPSPLQHNVVTGNVVYSQSMNPGDFYVSLSGGNPAVYDNDYFGKPGVMLNTHPDSSAHFVDPGLTADGRVADGAGIGFVNIDQSQIGLHPSGAHAY